MGQVDKIIISDSDQRLTLKNKPSDRLKTLGIVQDVNSFIVSMWQALKIHRPELRFLPAYPSYILEKDPDIINGVNTIMDKGMVTWNVVRRAPGSLDGKPFARTKEIRPRIREELLYLDLIENGNIYQDPKEPDQYNGPGEVGPNNKDSRVVGMEVSGQFFDNLIQFDVWAIDGATAEEITNYIEDFMEDFHGMFIELGVTKLHFHSRIRDEFISNFRNGLNNRSLLYYVRTEKIRAVHVREIKTIEVNTEVREYLDLLNEDNGYGTLTKTYQDQVIKAWVEKNS